MDVDLTFFEGEEGVELGPAAVAKLSKEAIGQLSSQVRVQHGRSSGAALRLGFLLGIAPEQLKSMDGGQRQKVLGEMTDLATEVKLPPALLESLAEDLGGIGITDNAIGIAIEARGDILLWFDDLMLETEQGRRARANVWTYGQKQALVALGYDKGLEPEEMLQVVREARFAGKVLGIDAPDLPERTGEAARDTATIIHYLLSDVGEHGVDALMPHFGKRFSALLELSIKTQLLLLLYTSEDYKSEDAEGSMNEAMLSAVRRSAETARVPSEVVAKLAVVVESHAPYEQVKQAVRDFNDEVFDHLSLEKE